uniref:Uncharacterized protein n=1 Tax=Glossina pallidipes TaxID=7398 RepID=A0A1A9ZSI9_GLOPL
MSVVWIIETSALSMHLVYQHHHRCCRRSGSCVELFLSLWLWLVSTVVEIIAAGAVEREILAGSENWFTEAKFSIVSENNAKRTDFWINVYFRFCSLLLLLSLLSVYCIKYLWRRRLFGCRGGRPGLCYKIYTLNNSNSDKTRILPIFTELICTSFPIFALKTLVAMLLLQTKITYPNLCLQYTARYSDCDPIQNLRLKG